MTLFPAASAGPNFHAAIRSGKFHGTTTPTTPSGSRVIRARASLGVGAISSYILSIASPYQDTVFTTAGTSMLWENEIGFPMSSVSSKANSSSCFSISSANLRRTFLR